MHREIKKCRICSNDNLVSVLNLGEQTLTGVFPKSKEERISSGPLELVKCHPRSAHDDVCHLVQLRHSFDTKEMYGANYGYRSGLNASMVSHLRSIVEYVQSMITLKSGDLIIDIGSNDSTLLQQYPNNSGLQLIGVDPTGKKFKKYYPEHISLIPDFFSFENISRLHPNQTAKVITSIAMFYDLEDPISFVKQISKILSDDGIWVFEQSYLPAMLQTCSYDTICHEHLEYYSFRQIKFIMRVCGLKIVDVERNVVNGGSFRVTVAKHNASIQVKESVLRFEIAEDSMDIENLKTYEKFRNDIVEHSTRLKALLKNLKAQGKKVLGYGASTKGNVILQYCKITTNEIPLIAEVNEEKYNSYTPFTHIPIVSEKVASEAKPNYYLVLPWHFREGILVKEEEYIGAGGKFIFPLPKIEIV